MEIWELIGVLSFPADAPGINAQEAVHGALAARDDHAAMPDVSDFDCMWARSVYFTGMAAAGDRVTHERGHPSVYSPVKPYLYASKHIYQYILSTNAAAAAAMINRIGYLAIEMTQSEWIEILEAWTEILGV